MDKSVKKIHGSVRASEQLKVSFFMIESCEKNGKEIFRNCVALARLATLKKVLWVGRINIFVLSLTHVILSRNRERVRGQTFGFPAALAPKSKGFQNLRMWGIVWCNESIE